MAAYTSKLWTLISKHKVAVIGFASVVIISIAYHKLSQKKSVKRQYRLKPFAVDARKPSVGSLENDKNKRNERIKKTFSVESIPSDLDVIVIGSGIGGLTAAAILAKSGRKVLVLEQHSKVGGCCHTFTKDGAEFDVGIHYVGEMGDPLNDIPRFLLDQLTQGQLEWARMADEYDSVVIKHPTEQNKLVHISVKTNQNSEWQQYLIDQYPSDAKNIQHFFNMIHEVVEVQDFLAVLKAVPTWIAAVLLKFRVFIPSLRRFFYYFHELTFQRAVEDLFPHNKDLQKVLGYCWGDVGVVPEKVSFGLIAAIHHHFSKGGFYPIGGASEIPYQLIPTIEQHGGKVLMKARVKQIVLSDDLRSAIGVQVDLGKNKIIEIRAPIIISDAGTSNTFMQLLPRPVAQRTKLGKLLLQRRLKSSCCLFQVFVSLNGSQEDLQLPSRNYFVLYGNETHDLEKWYQLSLDEMAENRVPFMFFGFPSAKDPSYNKRCPNRSSCIIITVIPHEWFAAWAEDPKGKRAEEYSLAKMALAEQAFEQVCEIFPQIAERRCYMDAGSSLTAQHYLNALNGESYGLEHSCDRFSPEILPKLRSQVSEVHNLFLTGQDLTSCGLVGAMMGGFLCANAVLAGAGECVNLMTDLKDLMEKARKNSIPVDAH